MKHEPFVDIDSSRLFAYCINLNQGGDFHSYVK